MTDDDTHGQRAVEVSNSGQFVATITLWPQNLDADNPTLISGTHTLDVEDSAGFVGSTTLTFAEPTISVVPDVVGPRDYVVITGTNWPIDNTDNSNSGLVEVQIADDETIAPIVFTPTTLVGSLLSTACPRMWLFHLPTR